MPSVPSSTSGSIELASMSPPNTQAKLMPPVGSTDPISSVASVAIEILPSVAAPPKGKQAPIPPTRVEVYNLNTLNADDRILQSPLTAEDLKTRKFIGEHRQYIKEQYTNSDEERQIADTRCKNKKFYIAITLLFLTIGAVTTYSVLSSK